MFKKTTVKLAIYAILLMPMVAQADINEFTEVVGQAAINSSDISTIYLNKSSVAIGTSQHGVYYNDKSDPFTELPGSIDLKNIISIAEFNSQLYVGNTKGLYVYKDKKIELVVLEANITKSFIVRKLLKNGNTLYIGTHLGLYSMDLEGKITSPISKDIQDIVVHKNDIYLASDSGIMVKKMDKDKVITWEVVVPDEFPFKNVQHMSSNGQDLFVSTNRTASTKASVVQFNPITKVSKQVKITNDIINDKVEMNDILALPERTVIVSTSSGILSLSDDDIKNITKDNVQYFNLERKQDGTIYTHTKSRVYELSLDSDGDGVADSTDNCTNVKNTNQTDADKDSIGEACDDNDDDKIANNIDNCPENKNPDQTDTDKDGKGDACDAADPVDPVDPVVCPAGKILVGTDCVNPPPNLDPTPTPVIVCDAGQVFDGISCKSITPPVPTSGGCSLNNNPNVVYQSSLLAAALASLLFTALYLRKRCEQK